MPSGRGGGILSVLGFSADTVLAEIERLASSYFRPAVIAAIIEDLRALNIARGKYYYQLAQEADRLQLDFVLLDGSALVVYSAREGSRATEMIPLHGIGAIRLIDGDTKTMLIFSLLSSLRENNRLVYSASQDSARHMLLDLARSLRTKLSTHQEADR